MPSVSLHWKSLCQSAACDGHVLCGHARTGIGFTGNTATNPGIYSSYYAALVVIGADPPLAGEELLLVEAVARHVQDLSSL